MNDQAGNGTVAELLQYILGASEQQLHSDLLTELMMHLFASCISLTLLFLLPSFPAPSIMYS